MNYSRIFLSLVAGLSLISSTPKFASAQDANTGEVSKKTFNTSDVTFEPPNEAYPKVTKAGASRGNQCVLDSLELVTSFTPLLPSSNYGLTVAAHPTIMAYVPSSSAKQIFLTLQNKAEEEVYQKIIPIGYQSGIIRIDVPKESPELEVGETYKWALALMCDNKLRPDSPVVEGYIKRVQPEFQLTNQLTVSEKIEAAAIYGKAGIWYDTISIMAQLRQTQPKDPNLAQTWNRLLNSVGLDSISTAEIFE